MVGRVLNGAGLRNEDRERLRLDWGYQGLFERLPFASASVVFSAAPLAAASRRAVKLAGLGYFTALVCFVFPESSRQSALDGFLDVLHASWGRSHDVRHQCTVAFLHFRG